MSHLWQQPYVNVFKHFNVHSWKKSSKEGEVTSIMDKTIKGTVYRITGSIPAGNYIQLPKTTTQSLGLTGRYLYMLFRPVPGKYFVVHLDVATQDGLIVRISFSNLFKEFKSTSTWLQFPFICHAAKGTVAGHAGVGGKDHSGPAPLTTRWTILCLDFHYILSVYLNRRFSYTKTIKLCANMLVKNLFTGDTQYEPGITFDDVKRGGVTLHGMAPLPREMAYPVPKTHNWHDYYDFIKFPADASKKPFDSIQFTNSWGRPKTAPPGIVTSPKRVASKSVHVSKCVVPEKSCVIAAATTKPKRPLSRPSVVAELPRVGVTEEGDISFEQTGDGEVHVYAHPEDNITVHHRHGSCGKIKTSKVKPPALLPAKQPSYKCLKPDPILSLRRIIGFGGATMRDVLWTSNGTTMVYPCHAVVVAMLANNGQQRFFIGHTDKVSCLSLNGSSTLLASGQTGTQAVVRVWKFSSAECLAMFKTHTHSLSSLSFSHSGSVLCGVGRDGHGKNMVVTWNTHYVTKGGDVSVMAKAHTDVDIVRMRIAAFDDTRMVSCGRDNIRLWRVKDGSLRSAPVNLGEYHLMEFTDCCFEAGYDPTRDPADRLVFAASRSGHVFEVDYRKVAIKNVRRLLPVETDSKKDKQTFNSGSGIAINTISVNEAFCVTGSDDGYMRLWPLDFKHVYLEAEHEGPVTGVQMSSDGVKILAATSLGNLGILDISSRGYTTVMRSHTSRIQSMALDPLRRQLATVSDDHTIRIWELDTMQQLYDFSAPKECPCAIAYHPTQQVFACGFESGSVRVFNVSSTSMLAEHRQHRGKVIGIAFSPSGDHMYSAGSLGSIALYDGSDNSYNLLRLLGNTVARGDQHGPTALAVSPDGKFVAFVGPTQFTVSVVDGRTLDEVLRIDITSLNTADNSRTVIDSAVKVQYTPLCVRQLLVTTSANKLLKFDARTGKILAEIDNVHRTPCSALDVSEDGRHLITSGDRVIKVWDYNMRLDLNFQVFIGHAEAVARVMVTPDSLSVISVGEALFIWDFLAHAKEQPPLEGRTSVKNYYTGDDEELDLYRSMSAPTSNGLGLLPNTSHTDMPREHAPQPTHYEPGTQIDNISIIEKSSQVEDLCGYDIQSVSSDLQEVHPGPQVIITTESNGLLKDGNEKGGTYIDLTQDDEAKSAPLVERHNRGAPTPIRHLNNGTSPKKQQSMEQPPLVHPQPTALKHFVQKTKKYPLAQRRYTAPPNQAGLRLTSVMGYNGNGRGNMVWNPDMGFFAYTAGCIVVVEDLNAGTQQHLMGHAEEISTLALQHDCQVLASASGPFGLSTSQICLWDLEKMTCKKVLHHHDHDIVLLAFSRDDRFLVSVGDYHESSIVVWSTYSLDVIVATRALTPVLDLAWDPYTVNEFTSVGVDGTMLFWLLDETGAKAELNVHEAEVPDDLLSVHHMGCGQVDFTCLEYAGDSTLYVGSSNGKISAWDTRQNTCFMHWEADSAEIDVLVSKAGRLVSGSASRSLKLWSVIGVGELRLPGDNNNMRTGGLTMEDEMNLDGPITVAVFDDTMDMGIVGTTSGTLWYLNWAERASIRLVSGHNNKVNAVALCDDNFLASCSNDGSLRVWSINDREQTLQFQVQEQSCNCLAFSPIWPVLPSTKTTVSNIQATPVMAHAPRDDGLRLPNVVAGYSDGTVRMFDLNKVEMVLKMHPHAVAVTSISFSADGRMILSGGSDGLVAVSSPTTGMTVRVISDHKGAPISCIDVTPTQNLEAGLSSPVLWLIASADRRVSIWSADWSRDTCELVDWLTFPAPAFTPDGAPLNKDDNSYIQRVPPCIAQFSTEEPDVILYTGYGMQKQIQFYSLSERKVVRTLALTHWATALQMAPHTAILAIATNERLLKLMDYYEGSFQDFVGHSDSLQIARFSSNGRKLFSASHSEILMWEVCV